MQFQHFQVLICLYTKAKRIIDLIFVTDPRIVNHHEKNNKILTFSCAENLLYKRQMHHRMPPVGGGRGDYRLWLSRFRFDTVYDRRAAAPVGRDR